MPWEQLAASLAAALGARMLDVRASYAPWPEIPDDGRLRAPGDPVFARLSTAALADLFDPLPTTPADGIVLVYGPGSALVAHDLLWYADLPKRDRPGSGAPREPQATSASRGRGRHRAAPALRRLADPRPPQAGLAPAIDGYLDVSDPAGPGR